MSRLKDIFGSFEMDRSFAQDSRHSLTTLTKSVSLESAPAAVDYKIQEALRRLYGKKGTKENIIGGHPDFDHLVETKSQKNGFVTTLFVDIQGSTRLGVFYEPQMVFYIKNQIIKCAIESILAFDGHVHRIMGDAVLAFFRGTGNTFNSAIDAINCGTVLVQYIREEVVPHLKSNGLEQDVGIRVGIDYGQSERVLWAMYGYPGVSEVTATSFYVDVAAKLQQNAPRNRVMLGQSIVDLLDLHDEVIEVRRSKKGGEAVYEPYISPNYLDANGKPLNYKQFVLSQDKYSGLLPYPSSSNDMLQITSTLKSGPSEPSSNFYFQCSRSIPTSLGIEFKAAFLPKRANKHIKVKFRVENHGKQAGRVKNFGNHETYVDASTGGDGWYFAKHWESTSYLGLHYMFISVIEDGFTTYPEQCFGVYVAN